MGAVVQAGAVAAAVAKRAGAEAAVAVGWTQAAVCLAVQLRGTGA